MVKTNNHSRSLGSPNFSSSPLSTLASDEFRALSGYTTQMTRGSCGLGVEEFVECWGAVDVDIEVVVSSCFTRSVVCPQSCVELGY
jgi:hypothetical protein